MEDPNAINIDDIDEEDIDITTTGTHSVVDPSDIPNSNNSRTKPIINNRQNDSNRNNVDDKKESESKQNDTNMTQEKGKSKKSKKKKKKKKKISDVIHFRNYTPKCEELQSCIVEPAKYTEIKDEFSELIERCKVLNHDLHDITPKKATWDLKRDVEPQLNQLSYLTKVAIRKLVGMLRCVFVFVFCFSFYPCTKRTFFILTYFWFCDNV